VIEPVTSALLAAAADLALPESRAAACAAVAGRLGCDALVLFGRDPEVDALIPPLGMPQTIQHAAEWRPFLERCIAEGSAAGDLPHGSEARSPAQGVATGGAVLVFVGGSAHTLALEPARPMAALLDALFLGERRADTAEVTASLSGQAASRARTLADSLRAMHTRLESALLEGERSRRETEMHAKQVEDLAEELRTQASHLEDQAAELEIMNAELEARTDEAETARALAEAANRAKSDFLATMSHELRTPINAIIGYSELIEMGISGEVSAEQRQQIERIKASSRHLLTLINDVLDLAKIEAGHLDVVRERCDLRCPVADALSLVALDAVERGIDLHDIGPEETVWSFGDENRVRQIVANLLSNAVKFTGEGGRVTVRCDVADASDGVAPVPGREGPWAVVEVKDTGIGIPAAEIDRVFQPFIQARMGRDREHGGTGLGLTISRQLARLMGGELTLKSEPGVGSTFTLYLPTRPAEPRPIDDSLRVGTSALAVH